MKRHDLRLRAPLLLALPASAAVSVLMACRPVPVHASSDAAKRGAEIFASSGCTHCHGPAGMGTERGPTLRDLRKHLSVEETGQQIVAGGKGMPAFGDTLDKAQVADLVTFLRAKTWIAAPPHADPAATP